MLIPATNGADFDNVSTPCALAKRIVGHYQPRGRVLDPCRGDAQPFYKVLLKQQGVIKAAALLGGLV